MAGSCSFRSRSRSKSPRTKEKRISGSPTVKKRRGRPKTRPVKSPSQVRKQGRPRRADLNFKREVFQKNTQSKADQTLSPNFMKPRTDDINESDTEAEENYDPNLIEPTSRVLRNQEEIDANRNMGRRSDPQTFRPPEYSNQQLPIYNATQPPTQTKRNFPTKQGYDDTSFDVARLLLLTPYDNTQATFASQEIIRLSIQRKYVKNIIAISWSLIQGTQLPYNLYNFLYEKLGGTLSIEEEFSSLEQLDGYVDPNEEQEFKLPDVGMVFQKMNDPDQFYVEEEDICNEPDFFGDLVEPEKPQETQGTTLPPNRDNEMMLEEYDIIHLLESSI